MQKGETRVAEWPRVPYVGVGCLVFHDDRILLVLGHRGLWSPPGGHLDFGESPFEAAVRETREETGIDVFDVEFVAITNDVLEDVDRHYVTIWMRGETSDPTLAIEDTDEIVEAAWFELSDLPEPRFAFFDNLLSGRSLPGAPTNLPSGLLGVASVTPGPAEPPRVPPSTRKPRGAKGLSPRAESLPEAVRQRRIVRHRHENPGQMSAGGASPSLDDRIRFAIAGKRLVEVRYSGRLRVVEPHDYGVYKGATKLFVYQLREAAPSGQKSASGWRWLELAKIEGLTVLDDTFAGSRGQSHQQHFDWDEVYARVGP